MPYYQTTEAEEARRMFAAGPSQAYYMEPPEAASKPFANLILWSSDGSTLLVRRLVPPAGAPPLAVAEARQTTGLQGMMKLRPRMQLVAWSRAARTSRTLLDFDSARATLSDLEAMPASDRALVLISETPLLPDGTVAAAREAYILLSTSTGAAVRLWTAAEPGEATTHIRLSPKRALGAILRGTKASGRTVSFFGADGKPGPEIPLGLNRMFEYADDGGPGVGGIVLDKRGKKTYSFRRLDPKTGALGPETTPDDPSEAPIAAAGSGAPPSAAATAKSDEPSLSLALGRPPKSEAGIFLHARGGKIDELGLVSIDGAMPLLSPRNDAVAYIMGNGAYVRAIAKVDRKAYELAMIEGEKQKAISIAKQVGTAMAMYAMDADDAYPLNDQKDSVDPYMKGRKMLGRFTYTYGGGIPGGPTTEIGYVAGPGGRAVVYADGSVKWVPDGF